VIDDATTLWDLLSRRAAETPDAPMLIDERDRTVSFAEFRDWCERVAAGLITLGVGADTPVAWQLPTRIESIVLSFALARLGTTQVPIIPIYREREVGSVLQQAGVKCFAVPGGWRNYD
jgi:non-ribosomal peptide synthetase component E (peptide arylation enzyme)